MKFKDMTQIIEKKQDKLKENENENKYKEIWNDFYKSSGIFGKQIKNMPINLTTEPILNKLNNFIKYNGYLTEPVAYNLLTPKEKLYIKKYSE